MNELFRDVAGYEGLYEVSSLGNVRSLNYRCTGQVKILKPVKNRCGYLEVHLCKEGVSKIHKIHRLVATAFIPNTNNLPEVNHIDEDKYNNQVSNLEWCDRKYNLNYGTRNERVAEALRGVYNNPKKSKKVLQLTLDGKIVREWASTMECGRNGFDHRHISACCLGKRKTHKGYRWMYAEDYYKMYAA